MNIEEAVFYTDNLPLLRRFYNELLGFELIGNSETAIRFKTGSSVLTFKQSKSDKPYYHFAFNITPVQIENSVLWLKNKGLDIIKWNGFEIIDFNKWNARSVYFMDPAGNILEFIARFDLPAESKSDFDASCVTSISEVGIVSDPVNSTRKVLEDKFGIFPFAKDTPTDKFCPMGDDNGLLIVVTEHRDWFPTTLPCKRFPLSVTLKNADGERKTLNISAHEPGIS